MQRHFVIFDGFCCCQWKKTKNNGTKRWENIYSNVVRWKTVPCFFTPLFSIHLSNINESCGVCNLYTILFPFFFLFAPPHQSTRLEAFLIAFNALLFLFFFFFFFSFAFHFWVGVNFAYKCHAQILALDTKARRGNNIGKDQANDGWRVGGKIHFQLNQLHIRSVCNRLDIWGICIFECFTYMVSHCHCFCLCKMENGEKSSRKTSTYLWSISLFCFIFSFILLHIRLLFKTGLARSFVFFFHSVFASFHFCCWNSSS